MNYIIYQKDKVTSNRQQENSCLLIFPDVGLEHLDFPANSSDKLGLSLWFSLLIC